MPQFDFLTEYVLDLLKQNGMEGLTDEQKNVYIPQLLATAEERIGMALLPKLSDEQLKTFSRMVETEGTTPEAWSAFWKGSVPNFEGEVKMVLKQFAEEVRGILTA